MPVERRRVDLTTGELVEIVRPGQRITGLSVINVPRGVVYGVKFGNSQLVMGFTGQQTFVISPEAPDSDTREGVYIQPSAPAANLEIVCMVSFYSPSR